MNSKVSAFILNFNLSDLLQRCVTSLLQQPEINEIMIIDNASSSDMHDCYTAIATQCASQGCKCVIDYRQPMISFAEAQNWGLDHASNDFVLLMNNDAYFRDPDSLKTSVDLMQRNSDIYLVGHMIKDEAGALNHAGLFYNYSIQHFDHIGRGKTSHRYAIGRKLWVVTAACLLVKRSNLRMDLNYWYECEDADFCLQHRQRGLSVYYNPAAVIIHNESSTRSAKVAKDPSWQKSFIDSQTYFKKKWNSEKPKFIATNISDNWHETPHYFIEQSEYWGNWVGTVVLASILFHIGGVRLIIISVVGFLLGRFFLKTLVLVALNLKGK